MNSRRLVNIYFSDFFEVNPDILAQYGAFNISLINDLPLFVDPFLLFNSENNEYRRLHHSIIDYVRFLRDKSLTTNMSSGLLSAWFTFSEVKQTWLGFSRFGNRGRGLGSKFAHALHNNLATVFADFGSEKITQGSHLEKLCLISEGVGRDNISDFTTNLIKEYLLEYTQNFATSHINPTLRRTIIVPKVRFNYGTESWEAKRYDLPFIDGDYVLLTPKDILTKDDIWISNEGMIRDFDEVLRSVPNEQLRAQINNYLLKALPSDASSREREAAIRRLFSQYSELVDYYIKYREDHGDEAVAISWDKVLEVDHRFVQELSDYIDRLSRTTPFYHTPGNSYQETHSRLRYLKKFIENQDGWRLFYDADRPIKREDHLQLLFRLTWCASPFDVNREVNNGRGPVDYKVSYGRNDSTLVEFKLASNSKLKKNLENQVSIYAAANDTNQAVKVIMFYTERENQKVQRILRELGIENDPDIVLIDARPNKVSASKV